jgi:CxxC motif-containing protein (DUF1111 family)
MRNRCAFGDAIDLRAQVWIGACCVLMAFCSVTLAGDRRHRSNTLVPRDFFEGKQLFEKSWEPGKPSPIGGDGLGPLYNEVSCVACHNLGGTGGGGTRDHDVLMLTAVAGSDQSLPRATVFQGELADLHPGFRNPSIVLHRHAVEPATEKRLNNIATFSVVQTRDDIKVLRRGSRNTPALFGSGQIDAISDQVLRKAEKRTFTKFPEIKGRVSTLPDGRIGRFGWKGQIATLGDFVRAACSNELGLEVPGHHQVSLASAKDFDPAKLKLDMNEEQCELLTGYVNRLSPPVQRSPDGRVVPPWGFTVFESIGCATCHAPKLGEARGIYSDLLLHDMGEPSSDSATYYGTPVPAPRGMPDLARSKEQTRRSGMADATEWRTPPLWGVADSVPYLHDGRAETLDDAIRRHDGEAAKTTSRYTKLAFSDRRAVLAFLNSLTVSGERRKPAIKKSEARDDQGDGR